MVDSPRAAHPIPVLDNDLCIGCGACETVCPSLPAKALVVSGLATHTIARTLPERPGSGAQNLTADPAQPGTGNGASTGPGGDPEGTTGAQTTPEKAADDGFAF